MHAPHCLHVQVVVDEKAQCYHCLYGFPGRSPSGKVREAAPL